MKTLLIFTLFFSFAAKADIFDVPKVQTVLLKKYDIKNEITAEVGYLPKDAFSKYIAFGGSYTHAFSDFTSWEMINALYTLELPAGLRGQLTDFGYDISILASQKYLVTTNIVFSPVYTKNLLFNSKIVYSQFSFVIGGGLAGFNLGMTPAIDGGFIMRFYLGSSSSFLKFDFRYNKFLSTNAAISDNYTIIFGYAFNLATGEFE